MKKTQGSEQESDITRRYTPFSRIETIAIMTPKVKIVPVAIYRFVIGNLQINWPERDFSAGSFQGWQAEAGADGVLDAVGPVVAAAEGTGDEGEGVAVGGAGEAAA